MSMSIYILMHTSYLVRAQQTQTCQDLNTLLDNRNTTALLNCTTNEPTACDSVTCSIPPGYIIETATLTVLPCTTPPAINILVSSTTTTLIGNFTFSESQSGSPIILFVQNDVPVPFATLDWDVEYSQMDSEFIGLQVNQSICCQSMS